jgi:transcriptional regulator with XRE-family HTH domain
MKRHRKQKRLTLDQVAEAASSGKSYIWQLENRDRTQHPSAEKLFAIGAALRVTPVYLLDDSHKGAQSLRETSRS